MKSVSGKKFCKLLEIKGWQCARVTESHHIYIKRGNTTRLSVPVHGNKDIKTGLLHALMKMADIEEIEL
ncbi:MAG: type II toxin-antitoxin system HicA family toxin [Deltaproteobacteria bacterium]|nr:type II toxin-antitoxin system HicA family toxin [Deltaproteobacteria bacterium]